MFFYLLNLYFLFIYFWAIRKFKLLILHTKYVECYRKFGTMCKCRSHCSDCIQKHMSYLDIIHMVVVFKYCFAYGYCIISHPYSTHGEYDLWSFFFLVCFLGLWQVGDCKRVRPDAGLQHRADHALPGKYRPICFLQSRASCFLVSVKALQSVCDDFIMRGIPYQWQKLAQFMTCDVMKEVNQ